MPIEIERKFHVVSDAWRPLVTSSRVLAQGYVATTHHADVRVRCVGERAYLTVKGKGDLVRDEFEYAIPIEDGRHMLETMCDGRLIHKTRHHVKIADVLWEVDEFHGHHQGLVLAEVELATTDQTVDLPEWIGDEVTSDRRFRNASLAKATAEFHATVALATPATSQRAGASDN